MDAYLYLILCVALLAPLAAIYAKRPDLRRKIVRASIVTAVAAVVGEYWHLADYWRPPTTVGIGVVSPEDALFGIAVGGLGATLYDVLRKTTDMPGKKKRRGLVIALLILGLAALFIFSTWLGYNSLLVSIACFCVFTGVMLWLRPDLTAVALVSALALAAYAFALYLILFTWLAPHYWEWYWMLDDTPLGIKIWQIPLTEIAWYASWGLIAGIIPSVASGMVKRRK